MTFSVEPADKLLGEATVSFPDEDGYHNGFDHDLIEFEGRAVALWSGPETSVTGSVTSQLYPVDVYKQDVTAAVTYLGADTWTDENDATYASLDRTFNTAELAFGWIPFFTGDPDAITGITLHFRASCTAEQVDLTESSLSCSLRYGDPGGTSTPPTGYQMGFSEVFDGFVSIPTDGVMRDYAIPAYIAVSPNSLSQAGRMLAGTYAGSGGTVGQNCIHFRSLSEFFSDPGPTDGTTNYHVAEAWIEIHEEPVTYTGGAWSTMIDVDAGGITLGEPVQYLNWVTDDEGNFDTHRTRRVGNSDLIVQWRKSGYLYTLKYDAGSDTFQRVDKMFPHLTDESTDFGGLVIAVSDDTILLVRSEDYPPGVNGKLAFAKWNGTTWDIGATTEAPYQFGTHDYQDGEFVGAGSIIQGRASFDDERYVFVTGDYPSAPVVESSISSSGEADYFNRQMYPATKETGKLLRFVAVTTGTTTPIIGGSDSFDWGMSKISVSGTTITEPAYVNTGPTTDFYDIAAAQTADGRTWVVHETTTAVHTSPHYYDSTLMVREVESGYSALIADTDDQGIQGNDYSIRCAAATEAAFLIGYCSSYNGIFRVVAFAAAGEPLLITGQADSTRVRPYFG